MVILWNFIWTWYGIAMICDDLVMIFDDIQCYVMILDDYMIILGDMS